tara:strand:+ start:1764 stop:3476 length:1713 start_codon:yes stop_codon:yes gene_type:complete
MTNNANYPRWSPLFKDTNLSSLKNANTTFDGTTNGTSALTDFAIPIGTKFYAEIIAKLGSNYYNIFGIAPPDMNLGTYARNLANVYAIEQRTNSGAYTINSISNTTVGSNSSSQGDLDTQVITYGIAVNRVDNEVKLYLDNTLKFTLAIPSTGVFHFMCSFTGGNNATTVRYHFNGGHDSTGAGDKSAGTSSDENGFGEFQFTPPSGHLACASSNLPTSTDIDAGGDDGADENPSKQFGVVTYTGTGSAVTISGLGFQPDFIWAKTRSTGSRHYLVDSSRGFTKYLHSEGTYTEGTSSTGVTSANSDGFVIGGSLDYVNYSGRTYVAWCWRANGGTTASNSDGSVTSTVQVNTKSKFSVVQWNGTGSAGATVGHGLNAVPKWIIVKNRDTAKNWACYHVGDNNNGTKALLLNTGGVDVSNYWNSTQPTSSVFSLGGETEVNQSSNSIVAYCWADVDGMQRFSSYVGTGSSEPKFIYTGFRPRMIFTMRTDSASGFRVRDTERSPNNPTTRILWWTFENQEYNSDGSGGYNFDIVKNGFVIRTSSSDFNANGSTYVYGAWADQSAKYSNAF